MANVDELKSTAETYTLKYLVEKATQAEDEWIEQKGVDTRYVNNGAPGEVARSLYTDATNEFFEEYPNTSEETLADDIQDYINQNYDSGFMFQQIEHRQNEEEILSFQVDDLVLWITNNSTLSNGNDDSYWYNCARRVQDIKEMSSYLSDDGIYKFVERYAPDYQEHLQ